jgi:hypothetical protein
MYEIEGLCRLVMPKFPRQGDKAYCQLVYEMEGELQYDLLEAVYIQKSFEDDPGDPEVVQMTPWQPVASYLGDVPIKQAIEAYNHEAAVDYATKYDWDPDADMLESP